MRGRDGNRRLSLSLSRANTFAWLLGAALYEEAAGGRQAAWSPRGREEGLGSSRRGKEEAPSYARQTQQQPAFDCASAGHALQIVRKPTLDRAHSGMPGVPGERVTHLWSARGLQKGVYCTRRRRRVPLKVGSADPTSTHTHTPPPPPQGAQSAGGNGQSFIVTGSTITSVVWLVLVLLLSDLK